MKPVISWLVILSVSVISVSAYAEELLFSSGFEEGVSIRADNPYDPASTDYQFLWGEDNDTGFSWPLDILGASESSLHFVHGNPDEHLNAEIETIQGHNGEDSRVLYTEKRKMVVAAPNFPMKF